MFLVFIADTGKEVFVWIGKHASEGEKKNGMSYATVCFTSLFIGIGRCVLYGGT